MFADSSRVTRAGGFALAAVFLLGVQVSLTHLAVLVTGVWVFGAQVLLYAFALVGLLGSIFIALVPRSPVETAKEKQSARTAASQ